MGHLGHRSKPAKRAGKTNNASLLEVSLIPLAEHADDPAIAKCDIKIGDMEITPTPAREKVFVGVERGELLSGIVAIQAVDDLGEKGEAAAFDVATRLEWRFGAADIDAGAIQTAHRMIIGQASAPRGECGQGARVLRKDCSRVKKGAAVGMQFLQETVSAGEQAATAVFRAESQIAQVAQPCGFAVHEGCGHRAGGDSDNFVALEIADGNGLVERAANFRAGKKIGLALERDFDISRDGIVDEERAELRVILALRQCELKLRSAVARLGFGYDSWPPFSTRNP